MELGVQRLLLVSLPHRKLVSLEDLLFVIKLTLKLLGIHH